MEDAFLTMRITWDHELASNAIRQSSALGVGQKLSGLGVPKVIEIEKEKINVPHTCSEDTRGSIQECLGSHVRLMTTILKRFGFQGSRHTPVTAGKGCAPDV